jgi:peptidoglycan hydrolase CwlO-like protein
LNEDLEDLLNDDDADEADIKALERKIKKLEEKLEEETEKYEELKKEIEELDTKIGEINDVIEGLNKDLGNAESVDTSAIEQGIANKKGEIEEK